MHWLKCWPVASSGLFFLVSMNGAALKHVPEGACHAGVVIGGALALAFVSWGDNSRKELLISKLERYTEELDKVKSSSENASADIKQWTRTLAAQSAASNAHTTDATSAGRDNLPANKAA